MSQRSQLYLYDELRKYLKSEIESFQEFYNERLFPNFDEIEKEAEEHSETFFQKGMESYGTEIDPASLADSALEKGIYKYQELSLIKYEFTASAISTAFMLWEQQTRRFLFNEMKHCLEIKMETFCVNFGEIKDAFAYHGVEIETLDCWKKINELQLLYNVIKHGDGRSAKKLRKLHEQLFEQMYLKTNFSSTIESTLLSEVLNISQDLFNEYCEALKEFWYLLPERSYGPELS
jgi:hypothetical protein